MQLDKFLLKLAYYCASSEKYKYYKTYKKYTVCDQRDRRYLVSIFLADLIASGIFDIHRMLFHMPVVSAFFNQLAEFGFHVCTNTIIPPNYENLLEYTLKRSFHIRRPRRNKKIEMGTF